MAPSRFVVTQTVTISPSGTITAGTYGSASTAPANTDQWNPLFPTTFLEGTPIYADSSAPTGAGTGAQQLYQALNAVSALRAFVDGTDDVGHAALSN